MVPGFYKLWLVMRFRRGFFLVFFNILLDFVFSKLLVAMVITHHFTHDRAMIGNILQTFQLVMIMIAFALHSY